MKVLLGLMVLLSLVACDSAPDGLLRSASSGSISESPIGLSKEKVPGTIFHLDGLAADARFIKDTTTGSFEVRPRVNVDPGARLDLAGQGCTDADSVYVVLFRVDPLEDGAHDRDQTWIATKTFPTTGKGWSGFMRVPRKPAIAEYGVWAVCELGGHAYFPSGWDVFVGSGGPT